MSDAHARSWGLWGWIAVAFSLSSAYINGGWTRGVRTAAITVVAAFAALGVSEGGAFAAEGADEVDWTEQGAWNGLTAPDAISASMLAVLKDEAVEDLSQRTETSQTFALPDGLWRSEMFAGPEWVATGEDPTTEEGWEALDTELVSWSDGSYRPGAHPANLIFSGASKGHTALVTGTDAEGGEFTLWWDGTLPDPIAADDAIRYVDVEPGIDLVFYVTATGYEQFFVAKTAAALDRAETLSLQFDSEDVDLTTDGETLTGTSEDGEELVQVSEVLAWDADNDALRTVPVAQMAPEPEVGASASAPPSPSASPSGSPSLADVNALPVEVEVPAQFDVAGDAGTVSIDADDVPFDSGDVFPVVIDPSVNLSLSFDTYLSTAWDTDRSTQTDLLIGTWDSGTSKYRSYINANVMPILGTEVISAELKLWNFHSWSCTARSWEVWSTSLTSSSTRWDTKPSFYDRYATVSTTKGYSSSCADGWVSADVTTLAANWAKGTTTGKGIGIKASSETDNTYWKKFNSGNAATNKPVLKVVYNRYPSKPSTLQVNGVTPASGTTYYINDTTPILSAKVSDPDGGLVKARFTIMQGSTTFKSLASGSSVKSGLRSEYESPALTNDKTYSVSAVANDGSVDSKSANEPTWTIVVDTDPPGVTAIDTTGVTEDQWIETPPANASATLTATDAVSFEYTIDGGATQTVTAVAGTASIALPVTKGGHQVWARAIDRAGNPGSEDEAEYGVGSVGISAPNANYTTTGNAPVVATAPKGTEGSVERTVYARVAGTDVDVDYTDGTGVNTDWIEVEQLDPVAAGVDPKVEYTWAASASVPAGKERVPNRIDVQVCFTYLDGDDNPLTTRCTWQDDDTHTSVIVIPHAFGGGFPTATAGPGQVALWTGEFNTAVTDLEVPAYTGTMSLSRSYNSFAGGTETSVFGPGWTASFEGSDLGQAGLTVVDSTGDDGVLAFQDVDGSYLLYVQPGGGNTAQMNGTYEPFDDDTAALGFTVSITGQGTDAVLTMVDDLGVTTTWEHLEAGKWVAKSITEPAASGKTTFSHDEQGRITQILAPVPEGVTCSATPVEAGCRYLTIDYYTATNAATNAYAGRVSEATFHTWDTAAEAMDDTVVARYGYNSDGYLTSVTDPRSGLNVVYGYGDLTDAGVPTLTSVTPAGLAAWGISYGTSSQGNDSVLAVTREGATDNAATTVVSRFVYGLDATAMPSGSPDVAAAQHAWGQSRTPTRGFAVFAQGDDPGSSDPATVNAAQWLDGDFQFTDDEGYTVNTASYGAGAWQYTADEYDDGGRIVRSLDPAATAYLIDQSALIDGQTVPAAEVNAVATLTNYNATDITATTDLTWDDGSESGATITAGTVLVPAGTLVTDTWAPAEDGEDGQRTRIHTQYTYDEDAPNGGINPRTGQKFNLVTTVTETEAAATDGGWGIVSPDIAGETLLSRTETGYDPIDAATATSDTSGWILSAATTTTTVMDSPADNITTLTRYDSLGRIVETRQPGSDGTDAGTELTVYYTAGANTDDAACGNTPQWAGLTCVIKTAEADPAVPEARTTAYSMLLAAKTTVETLDAVTRTTDTTYTADGRILTSSTATTGLADSQPLETTTYVYDETTGLLTDTHAVDATDTITSTVSTGYDLWGRTVTYTDTDGAVTTTTYDSHGRTGTVDDGVQRTEYTYDGTDAAGNDEHRGLPTAMTITSDTFDETTGTYPTYTFTAAFDAGGNMTVQTMPGNLTQTTTYTRTGHTIGLAYSGVDTAGETVPLIAWSQQLDLYGRVVAESTPSAGVSPEAVSEYNRTYSYDMAGRLVEVTDRTAGIGASVNTDPEAGDVTACATRAYTFDKRGNRLARTTGISGTDGACVSAGTGETDAWVYDDADRIQYAANTTDAYVYDALGRQTLIPAADTPAGAAAGDLQIGYYDNDLAASLTQNGVTTSYSLDALQRRATATTTSSSGTTTLVRHYTDSSDNPAWAISTDTTGEQTTSWYGSSLGGDLGITITNGIAQIQLSDIHGDIALPLTVASDDTIEAIGGYSDFDEYGNPLTGMTDPDTGAITYGWIGAKERATDTTGLMLMGVRLYNPVTGQFTSVDPVPGGNTTAYTYPQDPINKYDTSGKSWWSKIKKGAKAVWKATGTASKWLTDSKWGKRIGAACSLAWGIVGNVCNGVYAAAYARQGRWKEAAVTAVAAVAGGVAGKLAKTAVLRGAAGFRGSFSRAIVRNGIGSRRYMTRYDRTFRSVAWKADLVVGYSVSERVNW
ncbi:DNRLRE domain-containing protein [Demequina zhanjiangensis]|uniref:DNRLRE domain-containing protein n=1 Tax=Demequina zhanjiangensis TaxID=3051659 RepID=A0ABT8G198_9MICO|nr:DNRLRE domain-containing protein [Demequina sp. SYSU T00b26]MDN4472504.1 DNRLRE domain-containing protein [Demequina sp. SYSU T00b26]